jgi:lysophospholipase L1-like esterase
MKTGRALGTVLLTAASLLVALALAEVAVRAYAAFGGRLGNQIATWDPLAAKVEPHGRFGYRQRPNAVFEYTNGTRATANAQGWRGPAVAIPKPAGTLRIVLLGGSTTHGWAVNDDQTIDAYLKVDLTRRLPGRRIEVVNLAFDGYDAYQAWQRWLSDGVRLEPDAVVFNTGINDVRNARFRKLGDPDPRTLVWEDVMQRLREDAARGHPTVWTVAKHCSYLLRLPGVLRQRLAVHAGMPTVGEHVYLDAADNFERNVGRVVASAQGLGIPIVLSTPPSVLTRPGGPARMAPHAYWVVDPQTTQAYRDTLAARLERIARSAPPGGSPVLHVVPYVPAAEFRDDCHLTPDGNRTIAEVFADSLTPLLLRRAR